MGVTVQIRNLDPDVSAVLKQRAENAGISLSEYLRRELTLLAEGIARDEQFARLAVPGAAVPTEAIVSAIRAEREGR